MAVPLLECPILSSLSVGSTVAVYRLPVVSLDSLMPVVSELIRSSSTNLTPKQSDFHPRSIFRPA